jgi:hypothetical protein
MPNCNTETTTTDIQFCDNALAVNAWHYKANITSSLQVVSFCFSVYFCDYNTKNHKKKMATKVKRHGISMISSTSNTPINTASGN